MGLDWVLHRHRPKKGMERAYARALKKVRSLNEKGAAQALIAAAEAELVEVSHSPFEDIGAPQVGIDARATKYFLAEVFPRDVEAAKARGEPPPSKEAALAEAHGQYVVELARDQGGVAGGSFLVGSLDYGAGIIDSCSDVVTNPSEAWVDHTAKEAAAFAKRLRADLKKARSPADLARAQLEQRARRVPLGRAIAASGELVFRPWVPRGFRGAMAFEDQVNAVKGLIHWLEFWSKRGYGFHAWS